MAKFRQFALDSINTSLDGGVPSFVFDSIIVPEDETGWSMVQLTRQYSELCKIEYVRFDMTQSLFEENSQGLIGVAEKAQEFAGEIVKTVHEIQAKERIAAHNKKVAGTDMTRVYFRACHIMGRMVDAVRVGDKGLLIELGKKYMSTAQNWVANLNDLAGVTTEDIERFYMAQVQVETEVPLPPGSGTIPQTGQTAEGWQLGFAAKDPVVAQLKALPNVETSVNPVATTPAAIDASIDAGCERSFRQAEKVTSDAVQAGCTCENEGEMQLCPVHHPNLQSLATAPMSEAAPLAHFEEEK